MTQLERSGEQPRNHSTKDEHRGISIQATPLPDTGVVFQKAPDGGLTISFQGSITIDLPPGVSEAAGAVINNSADVGYRLIPDGTPLPDETAPASQHQEQAVPEVITHHITFPKASESILSASETPVKGSVLDNAPAPLNDAHSEPDVPSNEASAPASTQLHIPESENEKHEFVGNPVRDPAYWVRKSGTRIADFHLATHDDKGNTKYYRIRAFDDRADRVKDTVRRGQTGVEVVAYGPKYWPVIRATKDGQKRKEVAQGYYAGFVNVPRKYREENSDSGTQQPLA